MTNIDEEPKPGGDDSAGPGPAPVEAPADAPRGAAAPAAPAPEIVYLDQKRADVAAAPARPAAPRPSQPKPAPEPRKPPSLQIQFAIPNGMVGRAYDAAVSASVHKSWLPPHGYRPEDVSIRALRVDGLEAMGLRDEADGPGLRIVGEPTAPGDHPIVVHVSVLLRGQPWTSDQKATTLTINPDPRSLWKEIDPDPSAPFRRPHVARKRDEGDSIMIAASRRGRSHANKGEHRDDDFRVSHSKKFGWYAMAVADGAGSAPLSRRGAELACLSSIDALKPNLETKLGGPFHDLVASHAAGDDPAREAIHDALHLSLGDGGRAAFRAIVAEAKKLDRPAEHFATTLLLTIARRYPCGWFVAALAVGDGAVGAYRQGGEVVVLNRPDSGEFAGQTRFLTMSKIWDDEQDVRARIHFAVVPDLLGLVAMTDGVSDPKFPTERDLSEPARWREFWADLSGTVGLTKDNELAAEQLLSWLEFWAVGSHDDRTIAILLP